MDSTQADISNLVDLRDRLRSFAADREWEQYHSPKNLAMALVVEAAELVEHFQWLSEDKSKTLSAEKRAAVSHEVADVLIYLVRLADKLDLDLLQAVREKMELNARKYPSEKARGNSSQYTGL